MSPDGSIYAYSTSKAGSDWTTVQFRKTSGEFEELDDVLKYVKYSQNQKNCATMRHCRTSIASILKRANARFKLLVKITVFFAVFSLRFVILKVSEASGLGKL